MKILTEENPKLRKKSHEINDILSDDNKKLVDNMIKTMKKNDGIGLAAPQVGVLKKIIVINTKDGPYVLANPKIIKYSKDEENAEEGCLSIPGKYDQVDRSKVIKYSGILESGEKIIKEEKGLFARVIQHEVDHLEGILFIDRVKK